MSVLESCSEVLKDIYINKKPFAISLKSVVLKNDYNKKHYGEIAKIVSNELRHHMFIVYVVESKAGIKTEDKIKFLIYSALSNLYFAKQISFEEIDKVLKAKCSNSDYKKILPFLKYNNDLSNLLTGVKSGNESKEFLSIRYNTPLWFIKMIISDFGSSMSQKILKRNIQPNGVCLSVNSKETTLKKLLSEYKDDFIDFKEVEGTVLYKGKKSYFSHKAFSDGLVFPLKMGVKKLIKDLDYPSAKNITAYVYNSPFVALEIFLKYSNPKCKLTIVYEGGQDFKYFEKYVSKNPKSNVTIIKSKDRLDKVVSSKQDLVIINPRSSSFDLIKENIDFFNIFDENCFEDIVKGQMNKLIEAKNITGSKGKIVYFIDTIHKEEGNLLINEFKKLDDLIVDKEEKTRFSFEIFDTSMYYAILTKA